MNTWSWIKRLRKGKTTKTTAQSTTDGLISASRRDSTETDSSSYEPPPQASTPLALSVPSAFAPSSARDPDAAIPDIWHIGDVLLDQYDVIGILGEGGMGTVYKVHHRGWNTDLAVKSPKAAIFARAGGKENFIREAETWVKLPLHLNIVSCYYVRTLGNIPRVFAEYVESGSLSSWIRQRHLYEGGHKRALERMLDVAIQFAWGLHFAHEQGLVHQDVKPANVMMTSNGTVKVTDFGLAKARAMADKGEIPIPSAGESILVSWGGMTPAYCSPEQASKGSLSRKTDIWSWAVSVLEMFIGDITWRTGAEARKALANYEGRDAVIPTMPPEVMKLLDQCFQLLPENRPATMQEVAAELQVIYAHLLGPYPREAPQTVGTVADSLNNQALSLLDLGRRQEAQHVWEQALSIDPYHPETTYNWGVVRWREGTLADKVLVQQLEGVRRVQREPWQAGYLLAQVQLERGDGEAARALLEESLQQTLNQVEVQHLLAALQTGTIPVCRCLHTFEEFAYLGSGSINLSPDGRLFLSSVGKTVRVWEVASGRCLHILEGHEAAVTSVSLSVDGRLALSGSDDQTMRVWEVASGRCLHILEGYEAGVSSASLCADGLLAISATSDLTVHIWEVASGRRLRTFKMPASGLHSFDDSSNRIGRVALSADGLLAFSEIIAHLQFMDIYEAWVWEVASGRCLYTVKRQYPREGNWPMQYLSERVSPMRLSGDGRQGLLSGGAGEHLGVTISDLEVWDVVSGRCLRTLEGHTNLVTTVNLSVDGQLAISGSNDRTVRAWDVSSGRCLHTLEGHTDSVTSVSLSADGQLAISGSWDKTVRVWDLVSGRCLHTLEGHTGPVSAVCLSADGRLALSQSDWREETTIHVWNVATGRRLRVFPTVWRAAVSLSADGNLAISGSYDQTVRVWDVAKGNCFHTLEGHTGPVRAVSLSADGNLAISGSYDQTVRVWDVAKGNCLRTLEAYTLPEWVSLSADGRFAFSKSADEKLHVWEMSSGRYLHTVTVEGYTDSVHLSAHGQLALSGGEGNTIRVWDVSSGRCLHTLEGHTDSVTSVSLSADGQLAISGSWDKTVRVWDLVSGRCLHTLEGHTSYVTSVSLSADGKLAISGSGDNTVRVWDVSSGHCLRTQEGHTSYVTSVSLSIDGNLAISGSYDQTVRVWDVVKGNCLRTLEEHWETSVSLSTDGKRALLKRKGGIASVWEIVQQPWRCPLTPARVRSYAQTTEAQQKASLLLQQAEQALKETNTAKALEQVRAARLLPGWERMPRLLEIWTRLTRLCRKTNLRAAWLIGVLVGHEQGITSVSLSADGRFALSGSYDQTVRVWEVATCRCLHTLEGHFHRDGVSSVCLSGDGQLAISGGYDQSVRVWKVATGRCLHTLDGHLNKVTSVSLSADGKLLLSGSADNTVRVWDVATGRCLQVIEGRRFMGITSVSLSADGRFFLAGYANNMSHPKIMPEYGPVEVWDTASRRRLSAFGELLDEVETMSLSTDGRLILYGCNIEQFQRGGLRLWEVANGRCLNPFKEYSGRVTSVSLSGDGQLALSGSYGEARLWEVASGRCLHTFERSDTPVNTVSLSGDGQIALLAGFKSNLIEVWMLDWELDVPTSVSWDERADPFLETFLTLHTPFAAALPSDHEPTEKERELALTRRGRPMWTENDFEGFIRQLQCCGYGWLQPEEVRKRLEQIASVWWEPPPLPGA